MNGVVVDFNILYIGMFIIDSVFMLSMSFIWNIAFITSTRLNVFALKFSRNFFFFCGEIVFMCFSVMMVNIVNIVCVVMSVVGNLNFYVVKMDLLRNIVVMDVEL